MAQTKNIVICLDGTGNLFNEENSNVIKLFQVVRRKAGEQVAYYDPGVGTLGDPSFKTPLGKQVDKIAGAAFGRGLMKNLEEAYSYLMEHHEEGDRVFVFGFSRGAYTARALAGFINRCGLMEKGCENLIPYAMTLFLQRLAQDASADEVARFYEVRSTFRKTYGRRFKGADGRLSWQTPIRFLGLWDTVKSYGWIYDPVRIPRESTNESVQTVRHAISIDERRVLFPQMHWSRKPAHQDLRELWFAGVHSDVGGGYAEKDSGLAKIALEWMASQAHDCGLLVDDEEYRRIVYGEGPAMAAPDPGAMQHESLKGPWWVAEYLPWRRKDGSLSWWPSRAIERARDIPGSAVLHGSVVQRLVSGGLAERGDGPGPYRPARLPALTAEQAASLRAGRPLLPDAVPARLLVPMPDGSGDILVHGLTTFERDALLDPECVSWRDGSLQVLRCLATASTEAMRAAVSVQALAPMLRAAMADAQVSARFAAAGPAARWLRALTGPATSALEALGQQPAPAPDAAGSARGGPVLDTGAAAALESELVQLCAPLPAAFANAGHLLRWLDAVEHVHVLLQRDPAASAPSREAFGALVARLVQARSVIAEVGGADEQVEAAVDGLLGTCRVSIQAWIALAGQASDDRGPANVGGLTEPQAGCRAALVQLATREGVVDVPLAAALGELRGEGANVEALLALGSGRHLVVAHAVRKDEAIDRLIRSFAGVSALVRSRRELAKVPAYFNGPVGKATREDFQDVVGDLTRFMNRKDLPEQPRAAMIAAGGNAIDSLVTAAARMVPTVDARTA